MASNQQDAELRTILRDIMTASIEQTRAVAILAKQINGESCDLTALEAAAAMLASEARNTALLAQQIYSAARDMQRAA